MLLMLEETDLKAENTDMVTSLDGLPWVWFHDGGFERGRDRGRGGEGELLRAGRRAGRISGGRFGFTVAYLGDPSGVGQVQFGMCYG